MCINVKSPELNFHRSKSTFEEQDKSIELSRSAELPRDIKL